ncbi:MAG: glycosyltransferase [Pyrinomonadaceae bacterium]
MDDVFLKRCSRVYEQLRAHLVIMDERGAEAGDILKWAQMIVTFCWVNHTGRFADGQVENIILKIGAALPDDPTAGAKISVTSEPAALPGVPGRKILHVATTLYSTGGHTRLLRNFIKNDAESQHSLLVTDQVGEEIPAWLSDAVSGSGGEVTILPTTASFFSKAYSIRAAAQSDVDAIILHHHPNDLVPVLALATARCPPVAVLNHADHVFWIGSTVADVVIDFREYSQEVTKERRFAPETHLLPQPLDVGAYNLSRAEARRRLGIPDDQVMLLSIGSAYKYRPTGAHNFFRTGIKILSQNPEAHLYLIGVSWDDRVEYLREALHDRFHFLGVLDDPSLYLAASDLYLNGFPLGSGMALLEAAMSACLPLHAYDMSAPWLAFYDIALAGLVSSPRDESEYISNICSLIRNRRVREDLAAEVRARARDYHSGDRWLGSLRAIYRHLEGLNHRPHRIPSSNCQRSGAEEVIGRLNESRQLSAPLLVELGRQYGAIMTLRDKTRLFMMSLKARDTSLSGDDLKAWRQLFQEALRLSGLRARDRVRNSIHYRLGFRS